MVCSRSKIARRARIQYENAFYYVMNRGRGKRWIFHGTPYYEAFLKTLEESHQRYDAKFHAYLFDGKSLTSNGGDTAGKP